MSHGMGVFSNRAMIRTNSLFLAPHIRDLATSVYEGFRNQVARHGEGAVDDLAPIVIRILERVDELHEVNEVAEIRLGMLQNELNTLNQRVEREVDLRKAAEARILKLDDEYADTKSTLENHINELSGLVRILQTKNQNAVDHVARLEEKEMELRKEVTNAQGRYNDLLRSHVAHIERCRRVQRDQPALMSGSKSQTVTDMTDAALSLSPTECCSPPKEYVPPVARASQQPELSSEMPEEEVISPRVVSPYQKKPTAPSANPDMFTDLAGFLVEDPSDYEAQFFGQPSVDQNDDTEDLISSATADECDDFGMNSVACEVNRLVSENQDLIATKNALNVLKDDLLSRIDDLTGENMVLRHDLDACLEELNQRKKQATEASHRIHELEAEVAQLNSRLLSENFPSSPFTSHGSGDGPSLKRSSSLTHRSEQADNAEQGASRIRSQSCSNLHHFADGNYVGVSGAEFPIATASAMAAKPPQFAGQTPSSNAAQPGSKTGANSIRFTRREMARVVVERNYYKRKYLELQETVQYAAALNNAQQPSERSPSRGSPLSYITRTVQGLATDILNNFEELFSDGRTPTPRTQPATVSDDRSAQTRTSSALWNFLGNFVGQAVTYTADTVMSTGSGILRDVARPVVATQALPPCPRLHAPSLDDLPPGYIGRAVSVTHPVPTMSAQVCTSRSSSQRREKEDDDESSP